MSAPKCLPWCLRTPAHEVAYTRKDTDETVLTLTPCPEHLDDALAGAADSGHTAELLPLVPAPPVAALPEIVLATNALAGLLAEAFGGGRPQPFSASATEYAVRLHVRTYDDLADWALYLDGCIKVEDGVRPGLVHASCEVEYEGRPVTVVAVLDNLDVPVPFRPVGGAA